MLDTRSCPLFGMPEQDAQQGGRGRGTFISELSTMMAPPGVMRLWSISCARRRLRISIAMWSHTMQTAMCQSTSHLQVPRHSFLLTLLTLF